MAYLTIQINAAGTSVETLSDKLLSGDDTKPKEILVNLRNLLDSINSGCTAAELEVSSSTVAGTVTGQTGGVAAFVLNLK